MYSNQRTCNKMREIARWWGRKQLDTSSKLEYVTMALCGIYGSRRTSNKMWEIAPW